MWVYNSGSGDLYLFGTWVGAGYSGHGKGVNNPDYEHVPDVGPIPRGNWTIGPFFTDAEKGPMVARLTAWPNTQTFGRSGFMFHGDNPAEDDSASLGCIVMPHDVRVRVDASGFNDLAVV
jgi:hypothetical protein